LLAIANDEEDGLARSARGKKSVSTHARGDVKGKSSQSVGVHHPGSWLKKTSNVSKLAASLRLHLTHHLTSDVPHHSRPTGNPTDLVFFVHD
jgi:hypothetical protein